MNILKMKISDIDECSADSNICDKNADCTNSDGSYSCACNQGFAGDGKICTGIFLNASLRDKRFYCLMLAELELSIQIISVLRRCVLSNCIFSIQTRYR